MKVLLITTHLNFGGIASYTVSLARQLKKKGCFPVIASVGGDLSVLLKEEEICHRPVPLDTKSELSPKIWMTFFKLFSFVKREKIDIIHAQTRVAQIVAWLLSKATNVPFVSTCHGFFKQNLGRRIAPCWGRGVIAISDAVREHLVNDFKVKKKNIYLIYNGIEVEKFRQDRALEQIEDFRQGLGIAKDEVVVGIIGRLSGVKGHRFLLPAAKKIVQFNEKVKFLIIGDGPEKKSLLELVKKLDIEKYVIFSEPVLDTSLPLKAFDIFVMPSVQEGLGLAILEAMASGLPIVASNVGGIYTLVKEGANGFLLPPESPSAICEAINRLIEEPGLANQMAREGQRIAEEHFSLTKMVEKTMAFYEEAVNKKG